MGVIARRRFASIAAGILIGLGLCGPGNAGDGDDVLAKMQDAVRSAKSFSAFFMPTIPMQWVVVAPDRIRRVMPAGDRDGVVDWIVVGHQSYSRQTGKPWESAWHAGEAIRWDEVAAFLRPGTTASVLADRTEGRVPVGALDVLIPAYPLGKGRFIQPFHMTCTYDKTTYRPRTCGFDTVAVRVTTTYENWDDPANVVDPPPGVAPSTPAPQPSATP